MQGDAGTTQDTAYQHLTKGALELLNTYSSREEEKSQESKSCNDKIKVGSQVSRRSNLDAFISVFSNLPGSNKTSNIKLRSKTVKAC